YVWLVVAAGLLIVGALLSLAGAPAPPLDAERHTLGAGFVTLLIFGMGARLLPGFRGREHVAHPRLVRATFWLGNAAALLRVGPLLVPWLLALAGRAAGARPPRPLGPPRYGRCRLLRLEPLAHLAVTYPPGPPPAAGRGCPGD